jgi:hypothetical protein
MRSCWFGRGEGRRCDALGRLKETTPPGGNGGFMRLGRWLWRGGGHVDLR